MYMDEKHRWGYLLSVLSEMSDLERQVVVQIEDPAVFVPDDLLERWYTAFRGGEGLRLVGVSLEMLDILLEFDYGLDQVVDILPSDAVDKIIFLRSDSVWQAVREMAEWTLERITVASSPDPVEFGLN